MYVRATPGKPRKDGSKVEHVQLAHNVWDAARGRSQVQVIHTFGRSDRLDAEAMRRLAGSILKYLDGRGDAGGQLGGDADAGGADAGGEGLRLLASRPMGAAWLLGHLWSDLGFGAAIGTAIAGWTRRSSGCCSPWSRTGRSTRAASVPRWSGLPMTSSCQG